MNTESNTATQSKRERLIDSAASLFRKNGISATSLADIAKHADIPIGNVYYYFKTKDELALAAVDKHKKQLLEVYGALSENVPDPRMRLIALTSYFDKQRGDYAKNGCAIGKIINDMDVAKDVVARNAVQIMEDFMVWAGDQFEQLGHKDEARKFAISLMSGIQGAAVMAKSFADEQVFSGEMERLVAWLEAIPNKKIQLGKVRS